MQDVEGTKKLESVQRLEKITTLNNIKSFGLTYNRHEGRYGARMSNFPASYNLHYDHHTDFTKDPDWTVKLEPKRYNFKKLILGLLLLKFLMNKRIEHVDYFDRLRRRE